MAELLNIREACSIFKLESNTIKHWDNKGILKAKKIGIKGEIYYLKDDLLALINKKEPTYRPRVLDLFSGCGGLSYGLTKAGFDIVAGVDNCADALVTFERNHPGAKSALVDLGNFSPDDIEKIAGSDIDVVVGGPPCQGFSISGKRNPDDPRNKLYIGFIEVVAYYKPKAFILENVPNLISMAGGNVKDEIIKEFTALGYNVQYKVLLASDYGVPQNRKRVFFVGVRDGLEFSYPVATFADEKRTTSDAISDLTEYSLDEGATNKNAALTEYQKMMRKNTDRVFNHEISAHSEQTVSTIALVPDGGNYKDLPEHLKNIRKRNIAWTRFGSFKPSNTIDTGHRHHFHYKFNRIPTVRESARLQSFPDDFIFYGSKTSQYKQVGNAVPPILAEAIGIELKKTLDFTKGEA